MQYTAFREQIRLALDLKYPIVFHSRESHNEVFRVLREERAYDAGGVMHYFQGNMHDAMRAIDLGFYISLARPLLRLSELQQVAAKLPLESIVLETDAAPQPFKSKRENWTEPHHTRNIAERLAELQGKDVEEIEASMMRAIDLGFYISLARPLLRLSELQQVAAKLPLESIVLETDAAPQPFKSKRESWTEPHHTRVIAEKLAELQGKDVEEIEAVTSDNMRRLLGKRWSVIEKYLDSSTWL